MSKLSNKILKQVEKDHIKPSPRWHFMAKRGLIWAALLLAVLLTAVSVSMIIFQINNVEWDVLPQVAGGRGRLVFMIMPYFWIAVAVILFVLIYFDFRQTKTGYRYGAQVVVGTSFLIALILGGTLFSFHGPHRMEPIFEELPYYGMLHFNHKVMWGNVESGLLGGEVISPLEGQKFILQDFNGNNWEIFLIKPDIKGATLIDLQKIIKVIGEKTAEMQFQAREIRPWIKGMQEEQNRALFRSFPFHFF